MIGAAIGAGINVVSGVLGGISASHARKRILNDLNRQKRQNQDWYNRRYNEDATQRADAQAILTHTEDMVRKRNRQAAGVQAVIGGTAEGVAHEKEVNNQAVADATARIVADGEKRKDAIEAQYQQRRDEIQGQINQIENGKAMSVAQATAGAAQAAGNIAELFER